MNVLIEAIRGLLPARRPCVIGVGGAVAVGKTTVARATAEALGATIVSTDSFLLPNAVLAERDLVMRKGFPESYDDDLITRALTAMREGASIELPIYSHETYDIVAGETEKVDPSDIVIVEGVIALQPVVRPHVDVAVYVDGEVEVVRGWFTDRFLGLVEAGKSREASFYHAFASLEADQVKQIAEMTWDSINAVNLADHIAPSRSAAHVVVEKNPDHSFAQVMLIPPPRPLP